MARNMAVQRANKANRRKAIVAEKRKAEAISGSLGGLVQRAARLPIRKCIVSRTLFEDGIGTIILTRGTSSLRFELASFLVDVSCLGVKDTMFRTIDQEEYDDYVAGLGAVQPFVDIAPADARKLLRDVVSWAGQYGFAPQKDYAVIERAFGDAPAEASEAEYTFGRDGKPFFVAGPMDSAARVRRVTAVLAKRFGEAEAAKMIDDTKFEPIEDEFEDWDEEDAF